MNSGLPPRMMSVPRPAMLVAIVTPRLAARLGHDLGLALVVLGVQDLVRDAEPAQELRQLFRLLDRGRADQDRPAGRVDLLDLVEDRLDLLALVPEDHVGQVDLRVSGRLVGIAITSRP